MKKLLLLLVVALAFAACQKDEVLVDQPVLKKGELVGAHYNLNIIGTNDKTMNDIGAGNVIFVKLEGTSEINLVEGDDYAVLDKNGTDDDGALLQLPNPGFEPYVTEYPYGFDTETDYSVWARPLGKPLTGATITTMAELSEIEAAIVDKKESRLWDNITGEYDIISIVWGEFCPSPVEFTRTKGKQVWTNVTAELLSVVYEIVVTYDADPDPDIIDEQEITLHVRIPIFSELLEGEYWKYDNNGLKLLQLRFYPFGTDVTYDDLENGWD